MFESALPGELGSGFVVPRSGVVVKAVVGAFVNVGGVGEIVGLESFFVGRPTGVDASIVARVVEHERGFNLRDVFGLGLAPVEGGTGVEISAEPDG